MMHRAWRWPLRLMGAMLAAGVWMNALAAEGDCQQRLADVDAVKTNRSVIEEAQKELVQLGFDPGRIDGVLGTRTRTALMLFCDSAQWAVLDDLLFTLHNHMTIAAAYSDWVKTLGSEAFQKWANTQSDAVEIDRTRQSGDAPAVIALLTRYHGQAMLVPPPAPPPPPPTPRRQVEDVVTYALTADDLAGLRSRSEVMERLGALQGTVYGSRNELQAALKTALEGVPDLERYMAIIEAYAKQPDGRRITTKSLDDLKVENVPDHIVQTVSVLNGLNFPGQALDGSVNTALAKSAARALGYRTAIVYLAEASPNGIMLTEDSLNEFSQAHQADPLVPAILSGLQKLKGVEYKEDTSLSWAVGKVLTQVAEQIDGYGPAIMARAETVTGYSLDQDRLKAISQQLNDLSVPQAYLNMMGGLQDVDYPDPELFWRAVKAKVALTGAGSTYRQTVFGIIGQRASGTVDPSIVDAAELPPFVKQELAGLLERQFSDTKALEAGVDDMFARLDDAFDWFKPLLVGQARKQHPFDKTKAIRLSGDACACVHNDLEGEVYGFYPYWFAGEDQKVDLSTLTRIGYYALGFDDKGNILHASRWTGQDTDFIEEARRYGSKVDLVIYRNDWETWQQASAAERTKALQRLAANIAALVNIPLTSFSSRAEPYISLGLSPQAIRGDGVTLHFDGYPQDPASVDAFVAFIKTLSDELKTQDNEYFVNIMFRSAEIGKGIYDYRKLLEIMDIIKGGSDDMGAMFLALLQEPTTMDKKRLRRVIEDGLHGEDRMKLVRHVAPVLSYDGRTENQLVDDVIYAGDIFGGIGFWPLPIAVGEADPAGGAVSRSLHADFVKTKGSADEINLCKYLCPNKWGLRVAWDVFAFTLLACVIPYFVVCSWRNLIDQRFLHFIGLVVVPLLVISIAQLFCDPGWAEISRGNGLLILMLMGIIAYSIWNYYRRKERATLP